MSDLVCFSNDQIFAWQPDFDRNNLTRWIKKGLLIRLRQGYFTFPEYRGKHDYAYYIANQIYRPSYISLHTALSFYGLIPEAVVLVTSITSLKTATFINFFGEFNYKTIKKDLMFGYEPKLLDDGKMFRIATPEKALSDLLYLYPEYCTTQDLKDLRLDEDFLHNNLKKDLLKDYVSRFKSKTLENRINKLFTYYGL
jgi:predicted transcriptional regulator of viral defense system